MDDDDEWSPNKIEEQLKGFTDNTIALVYCGMVIINEKQDKRRERKSPFKKGYVYNELLKKNFIGSTSNPLIKRTCIDRVGHFDIDLQSSQDYDLWLRLAKQYAVNYIEKPLLFYHIHNNARITTDFDKQISGKERIIEKYYDDIERNNKIWHMKHMTLVVLYAHKRLRKKAFSLWIRCVKKCPSEIIDHSKLLLLNLFGFDTFPYNIYKKAKDSYETFVKRETL